VLIIASVLTKQLQATNNGILDRNFCFCDKLPILCDEASNQLNKVFNINPITQVLRNVSKLETLHTTFFVFA